VRSTAAIRLPLNRVIFAICILLLTVLSITPDWFKRRLHTTGHFHYVGHIVMFAVTAFAVTCSAVKLRSKFLRAGYILAFGIAMESAEAIAYHGWFEKRDLLADVAGLAVGLLCTCALQSDGSVLQARVTETSSSPLSDPRLCSNEEVE
jgi:hypothetical protein